MTTPELIIIAAQTQNRVIGDNGDMPWHLPRDLQWFRKHTKGHPVIMGRRTYQAIGKALPERRNIVITRTTAAHHYPDAEVVSDLQAARKAIAHEERAYIIGGGQLYAAAMPIADRLIITHIHTTLTGDTHFPEIIESDWQCIDKTHHPADTANPYALDFCTYIRKP